MSLAPLWLRLPSTLLAVATWFVLSRGVLGAALPVRAATARVRALAAVCLLAAWLPFNLGTRPESYVALGVTVGAGARDAGPQPAPGSARAGADRGADGADQPEQRPGRRRRSWSSHPDCCGCCGRPPPPGGTWSPTCAAVLRWRRWAHRDLRRPDVGRPARSPPTGTPSSGRRCRGTTNPIRYRYLLRPDQQGSSAKRMPVLLAVAMLPVVGLLAARRRDRDFVGRAALRIGGRHRGRRCCCSRCRRRSGPITSARRRGCSRRC